MLRISRNGILVAVRGDVQALIGVRNVNGIRHSAALTVSVRCLQ